MDRSDLYAVALSHFARYGFKRARVEDIAAELGMTKGNVYHYVASKEALYQETVEWALAAWYEAVAAAVAAAPSAAEAFRMMAFRSFAYVADRAELRALLESDPTIYSLDPSLDRFAGINRSARDLLAGVVARGMSSGEFRRDLDAEATADFLFAVYIAFLIKTFPLGGGRGSSSPPPPVEAGIDLAVRGLEARDGDIGIKGGGT